MRFTVSRKLWLGFLAVLLLVVSVGASAWVSLNKIDNEYRSMLDVEITKMVLLEKLASRQAYISNNIQTYFLFKSESSFSKKFGWDLSILH